jgi:hypothetical protein
LINVVSGNDGLLGPKVSRIRGHERTVKLERIKRGVPSNWIHRAAGMTPVKLDPLPSSRMMELLARASTGAPSYLF